MVEIKSFLPPHGNLGVYCFIKYEYDYNAKKDTFKILLLKSVLKVQNINLEFSVQILIIRYYQVLYHKNLLSLCCHDLITNPQRLDFTGFFTPCSSSSARNLDFPP